MREESLPEINEQNIFNDDLPLLYIVIGGNTMVEHLPHQPRVEGSSPGTATGNRREKIMKNEILNIRLLFSSSTVVEHTTPNA